jgi:hypothetical protein
MGKVAYGRNLMYTTDGIYKSHVIEWATAPHRVHREKSVGYFRIFKSGGLAIYGVVGEAFADPAEAKAAAIKAAMSTVSGKRLQPSNKLKTE